MSIDIFRETPRMPPDLRPPVDSTALRDLARQVVVRVLVEVLLNRITIATAFAYVVAAAAAIATQQYSPEEPMLPPASIPFVFGTQLEEEPLPWPTLAAPPRTIYQIVETQETVTRSVQDLALEDELDIAQAELRAERGRTSRLNDELARLEQELTNVNESSQAAQDALGQLTRERDRLKEELAEASRPPERERIGSFGGIMNVYQSPPPEHAYVDEPIRILLFSTRRTPFGLLLAVPTALQPHTLVARQEECLGSELAGRATV